jgi:hypothetical protein
LALAAPRGSPASPPEGYAYEHSDAERRFKPGDFALPQRAAATSIIGRLGRACIDAHRVRGETAICWCTGRGVRRLRVRDRSVAEGERSVADWHRRIVLRTPGLCDTAVERARIGRRVGHAALGVACVGRGVGRCAVLEAAVGRSGIWRAVDDKNDARVTEAKALIASKRDGDGRWPLEPRYPGAMALELDDGEGRPSRWNTLRALRVLRWYERGKFIDRSTLNASPFMVDRSASA